MLQCHQQLWGWCGGGVLCWADGPGRRGPLFREMSKMGIIDWPQVRMMMNREAVEIFYLYLCKVGYTGILFDKSAPSSPLSSFTRQHCNLLLLSAHLIIDWWQMSNFTKVITNELPCCKDTALIERWQRAFLIQWPYIVSSRYSGCCVYILFMPHIKS